MLSSFRPLGAVLKSVADRHGFGGRLFEYQLQQRWTDIVGLSVAEHTRPDQIRFRKLYLLVENSVWLQQLVFLKPALIERINAAAGVPVVSDIMLRVGDVTFPQNRTQRPVRQEAQQSPTSHVIGVAHESTAVKDPELRAKLADVMATALHLPH